jgi:DNA-binding NarL/FixJ family response regulator
MRVRTVLADHAELSLIGLRTVLKEVPRVELVGEARDRAAMLDLVARERPHVVLIDHTAEGFGAEAIREGLKVSRRTRFVAITPDPSHLALTSALRAGVTSYIKKDCDVGEIIDAVLQTADGEKFFCGKIVDAIQRASLDVDRLFQDRLSCAPVTLSERECEIIGLIAEGFSYTRIADRLCLSAHTVTTHRRNIMQKLGVNSTAAVVMYAVKSGLVSPNKFLFNS